MACHAIFLSKAQAKTVIELLCAGINLIMWDKICPKSINENLNYTIIFKKLASGI